MLKAFNQAVLTLNPALLDNGDIYTGGEHRPPVYPTAYLAISARAAAILAFTESRLKLAPFCIGGNSIAVSASLATCCWTNTKRQNWYLNQSKYCC